MFEAIMMSVPFGNTLAVKMTSAQLDAAWIAVQGELTPDEERVLLDPIYTIPFRWRNGQETEEGLKLIKTALQLSMIPGVPDEYVHRMAGAGRALYEGKISPKGALQIIGHTEGED